jgi:hypothetical protein
LADPWEDQQPHKDSEQTRYFPGADPARILHNETVYDRGVLVRRKDTKLQVNILVFQS